MYDIKAHAVMVYDIKAIDIKGFDIKVYDVKAVAIFYGVLTVPEENHALVKQQLSTEYLGDCVVY